MLTGAWPRSSQSNNSETSMKRHALMMFALTLAAPAQGQPDAVPPQARALEGEWVLLETSDEKRVDPGDDNIRMLIKGSDVTMKFVELTTNRGTVHVGDAKRVTTLAMKFNNGKAVHGVYRIRGDVLIICVEDVGNARPDGATPKGTQWAEKWKRASH
jgi:uncharacterized protein (TIGR03067 family)